MTWTAQKTETLKGIIQSKIELGPFFEHTYFMGYVDALYDNSKMSMDILFELKHWLCVINDPDRKILSPSTFNGKRPSALHLSVLVPDDVFLDALLREKSEIDVLDAGGNTPLHLAVLANDYSKVQKLLMAGANPRLEVKGKMPEQRTLNEKMIQILKVAREQIELEAVGPDLDLLLINHKRRI